MCENESPRAVERDESVATDREVLLALVAERRKDAEFVARVRLNTERYAKLLDFLGHS